MRKPGSPKNKTFRRCISELHLGYARLFRNFQKISSMKRVITALVRIRAVLTGFGVAIIVIPSTFAIVGRLLLVFCFLFYRWLNETNPFRITGLLNQLIASKAKKIDALASNKWLDAELKDILWDLEELVGILEDQLTEWKDSNCSRWQMNLRMMHYAFGASWALFCIVFTKLVGTRQSLH